MFHGSLGNLVFRYGLYHFVVNKQSIDILDFLTRRIGGFEFHDTPCFAIFYTFEYRFFHQFFFIFQFLHGNLEHIAGQLYALISNIYLIERKLYVIVDSLPVSSSQGLYFPRRRRRRTICHYGQNLSTCSGSSMAYVAGDWPWAWKCRVISLRPQSLCGEKLFSCRLK